MSQLPLEVITFKRLTYNKAKYQYDNRPVHFGGGSIQNTMLFEDWCYYNEIIIGSSDSCSSSSSCD